MANYERRVTKVQAEQYEPGNEEQAKRYGIAPRIVRIDISAGRVLYRVLTGNPDDPRHGGFWLGVPTYRVPCVVSIPTDTPGLTYRPEMRHFSGAAGGEPYFRAYFPASRHRDGIGFHVDFERGGISHVFDRSWGDAPMDLRQMVADYTCVAAWDERRTVPGCGYIESCSKSVSPGDWLVTVRDPAFVGQRLTVLGPEEFEQNFVRSAPE